MTAPSSTDRPRTEPRWATTLALLALVLTCSVVGVEVFARLTLPSLAWLDALRADAHGYLPEPSCQGVYEGLGSSGMKAPFTFNEDGARGAIRLSEAATVALGSSYTFGLGVADRHAWPRVLSDRVGAICNLGLPGMDAKMASHRVERLGAQLRGKTVLWSLQSDDLRRTPAQRWLSVRAGLGRYSAALAWWRLKQVPTGRQLLRDRTTSIDSIAALRRAMNTARAHQFRIVLIRLSALGDGAITTVAREEGLAVVDVESTLAKLAGDPAMTVEDGAQLSAAGNAAFAAALQQQLRALR